MLIAWTPTIDIGERDSYRDAAIEIAERLTPLMERRIATSQFLQLWGAFNFSYALAMHDLYVGQRDPAQVKAARAAHEKKINSCERRWLARELLLRIEGNTTPQEAERNVAVEAHALLSSKNLVVGHDVAFLKTLFGKDGRFKSSLRGMSGRREELLAAKKLGWEGLPPALP